ncbi:unnamed protein product [Tetraodon nigroviridis]|nr:unnamed protein product [Tetraodon nigroviridis]
MEEQVNPLERDHALAVVLPGGLEKNATVHGSKPVMDVLVTLCASYHLNPSDYTVEVFSANKNNISFKPNSPIGSLEAEKIVLKPKSVEEKIRRPYMPEASVRLLVNYNRAHKTVVRVSPTVPLEMLLPAICDKCEFGVQTTVLLRDPGSDQPLDTSRTLNELGLRELFAKDTDAREPEDLERQDRAPEAELPKVGKKPKKNTGFLSLFRKGKKKPEMEGALSAPVSPSLDSLSTLEEHLESDESVSTNLTPPPPRSSPEPRHLRLSFSSTLSSLHEMVDPYLPSFGGKDWSDARSALAKVLTSSVSRGALVRRLKNSAAVPSKPTGPDPVVLDQIEVEDEPVVEGAPESEEEPLALEACSQDDPGPDSLPSRPPSPHSESQVCPDSPPTEEEEEEGGPEVTPEVGPARSAECGAVEAVTEEQIGSAGQREGPQSPTQSGGTDEGAPGPDADDTDAEAVDDEAADEAVEEDAFPPPPSPVFFTEDANILEEVEEAPRASCLPSSSQPSSPTSTGPDGAPGQDPQLLEPTPEPLKKAEVGASRCLSGVFTLDPDAELVRDPLNPTNVASALRNERNNMSALRHTLLAGKQTEYHFTLS